MKKLLLLLILASALGHGQKSKHEIPQYMREDPFYKVVGDDKMWTIEVTGQKISYISILPNESFEAPYKTAIADGKKTVYKSASKTRSIEIRCSPNNALYDEVTLIVTGADGGAKQLAGQGQYIPDDRLNVVWILRDLGTKKMSVQDFGKELPYLDLHINDGFFTGFAGCNRIQGKLALAEDSRISMSEVSGSRMQCNTANRESDFMEMLKRVDKYEIRGQRLYLLGKNGTEAVFNPGTTN